MAAELKQMYENLRRNYPGIEREWPHIDPDGDDWDEFITFCRELVRRGKISGEDTDELVRIVRSHVYGSGS